MTPWEDAWLNGKLMPPHEFPSHMLMQAEAIAEELLFDANFRSILEDWVPRKRADEAMGEVIWSGCRVRRQAKKRVPPVPVIVDLMYVEPYAANIVELEDRMRADLFRAIGEWLESYRKYGSKLEAAP